jgi:hypothetical protein
MLDRRRGPVMFSSVEIEIGWLPGEGAERIAQDRPSRDRDRNRAPDDLRHTNAEVRR